MRVCPCCGESKPAKAFSRPGYNRKPVSRCLDCGVWLRLLRQVFGATRDWDKNRERATMRSRAKYQSIRSQPAVSLYQAWGIGVRA